MWWRILLSVAILFYAREANIDYKKDIAKYQKALIGEVYLSPPTKTEIDKWKKKEDIYNARQTLIEAEYPELFTRIEYLVLHPDRYNANKLGLQSPLSGQHFRDTPGKEALATFVMYESDLSYIEFVEFSTYLQIKKLANELQHYYHGEFPKGSNPSNSAIRSKMSNTEKTFSNKLYLSFLALFIIWSVYFYQQWRYRQKTKELEKFINS